MNHSIIIPAYREFSAEVRALAEQTRQFAHKEVLPLANKLDPVKGLIPRSLVDQLAELGYFGLTISEEYGGLGLGVLEYCIVCEELSRAWMSVASLLARGNSLLIGHAMSKAQKKEYLPQVATGQKLCALAMSEPEVGSDLAAISCTAKQQSDGQWAINGSKYWCTYADQSDLLIVVARTSPMVYPKKYQGLSAFIIEKKRGEFPKGITGNPIPKIGYFGWNTFELNFDQFKVPSSAMIGQEGAAFKNIASSLEEARLQTASRSIGLARGALEDACGFAKERHQFDGPLTQFQDIRFKLAKMAVQVESARSLTLQSAVSLDQGHAVPAQAAMAKYLAAEMSEKVTSQALQIHGGAGYTTLYPAERYWRDARLTKIFEGSSEIQLKIISDSIIK